MKDKRDIIQLVSLKTQMAGKEIKKHMRASVRKLSRGLYAAIAALVAAAAIAPLFLSGTAYASLITSRNIEMSNATLSATNVTYTVSFNTISTGSPSIQAIIVDFCDNDPILGDTTCTAPGGFSISSPTVSGQSTTAGCNISTFTVTTGTAAGAHTLELSAASAINVTTTPCAISFSVTNVTNPNSANHSFYARIYTYDTKAHADSYTAGGSTGVVDSGGIALSTSALITVTATVQETMTFCVTTSSITGTCGGALAAPAITLGHAVGSSTVLTATQVDIAGVNTQISTNANGGWVVRMKAGNSCSGSSTNGGLSSDGGTTCAIAGKGSSAGTIVAGDGTWGMCVNKGANTTIDANYADTGSGSNCPSTYNAAADYGMDGTGTTSTYGDQIFSGSGAVSNEANTLEFVATAANITPAGVYTGSESLIATGTF